MKSYGNIGLLHTKRVAFGLKNSIKKCTQKLFQYFIFLFLLNYHNHYKNYCKYTLTIGNYLKYLKASKMSRFPLTL